jgi:hypothetical protein
MNDLNTRVHSDSAVVDADAREELNAFHDNLDASILDDFDAIELSGVDNPNEFHTDRSGDEFDCERCGEAMEETDDGFFCSMCDDFEDDGQPDEAQEWFDFNGGFEC